MSDTSSSNPFQIDSSRSGFTTIPVLEFLYGLPWSNVVTNYIYALRPRTIQVLNKQDPQICNWVPWRVTVILDDDNTVKRIEQEVEVLLEGGFAHGHDLDCALKRLKETT